MKQFVRLGLFTFFGVALAVTSASAAPIVCSASIQQGQGPNFVLFQASVDPAVSCEGPFEQNNVFPNAFTGFGYTWLAQDKDEQGNVAPENGAGEDVLELTGVGSLFGTFTIDPTTSQCGPVECNFFVFGLKGGPVVTYFDLGNITSETTFNWTLSPNALSNGAVYGRFAPTAPEPGLMFLLATGAVVGLRRRFTANR